MDFANLLGKDDVETIDTDRPREAGTAMRPGTGAVLRSAREEAGLDLVDVAKVLRIRPLYLQAIEDGRYQDLPGSAYVIGFIRTYSQYLGLDAAEIVRRFKHETEGALEAQPELVFPAPISDGQLPTRAIILGSLLAAVVAYGAWYHYSDNQSPSELVSELPERLRPVVAETEAPEPAPQSPPAGDDAAPVDGAAAPDAEPDPAPVEAAGAEAEAEAEAAAVPALTAPAEETVAAESAATAETADADADADTSAGDDVAAEDAATEESAVEDSAAEAAAVDATADEADAALAPESPVAAAPARPVPPPPAPPTRPETAAAATGAVDGLGGLPAVPEDNGASPSVFGRHNADSRITVLAVDEAWIQVRDADNRLLLSRLMRAGDRYLVPNRDGLQLITGSAGDVRIFVDGQQAPSLGEPGEVRRDIRLEADYLLAGN